jgi:large subunit ribosomal protein L15
MQLHQLKLKHKLKRKKRVGRGGKRGTYSGRGSKGQRSRAGRKFKPAIRGLIKRYPKLKPAVVNIEILEKKFKDGDAVTPKVLIERGLIRRMRGRLPKVKILGLGKLTKKLTIEGCQVSKSARKEIEKAGGTVK